MTSHLLISSVFSIALMAQFASTTSAATIVLINEPFNSSSSLPGTPDSPFIADLSRSPVNFFELNSFDGLGIPVRGEIKSKQTFDFSPGDIVNLSFTYKFDGGSLSLINLFRDDLIPGSQVRNYARSFVITSPVSTQFSFVEDAANVQGFTFIKNFVLTNTTTAVPEPLAIVGTLVGGMAALGMKKKLKEIEKQ